MKEFKFLVGTMAVCSLILILPTAVDAAGEANIPGNSPAKLVIEAGSFGFKDTVETSAKMDFKVKLNGADQTVDETGTEAYVAIEDNRGVNNGWTLSVKEADSGEFVKRNFILTFKPTTTTTSTEEATLESPVTVSTATSNVAKGGKLEHKIVLNPTLEVPATALASDAVTTTLEWTLSPTAQL